VRWATAAAEVAGGGEVAEDECHASKVGGHRTARDRRLPHAGPRRDGRRRPMTWPTTTDEVTADPQADDNCPTPADDEMADDDR
jgi:hypothetical protein